MTERTLILLRHGKSDWSGGEPDADRPLADRGRRQAPEAGRWLAASGLVVDLAVVSPATRARSTWDLVAPALDPAPPARLDDRLYAASADRLLEVVRGLSDDHRSVILVGHNPGLEDLAEELTGEWTRLPTAALAVIDLPGPWRTAGEGDRPAVLRTSGRPPA